MRCHETGGMFMTIEAVDQSANPWLVGMPDVLAATVFRCDEATRRLIIGNWDRIGAVTRQEYRNYLASTRLSWRRQPRVRELVLRLITGSDPGPTSAT